MEQSALKVISHESAEFVEPPPVQIASTPRIIAYQPATAVPFHDHGQQTRRRSKRRAKFFRFITIEATACLLLIGGLFAGTSKIVVDAGLILPFEILTGLAILAVAIIPVLFYGSTTQRHRYRASR